MRPRMPQGSPMENRSPRSVHVTTQRRMRTAARISISARRHPEAKKAIGSLPRLAKDISQYSGCMGPQKPPSTRVGSLGISRSSSPLRNRARGCRVQRDYAAPLSQSRQVTYRAHIYVILSWQITGKPKVIRFECNPVLRATKRIVYVIRPEHSNFDCFQFSSHSKPSTSHRNLRDIERFVVNRRLDMRPTCCPHLRQKRMRPARETTLI